MQLILNQIGKKFGKTWIFRKIDLSIGQGARYVIQGPNGSGKSTLLQITSGYLIPDEGTIEYTLNGKSISVDSAASRVSIAAPYLEVIEELTLNELLNFHTRFRTLLPGLTPDELVKISGLDTSANKPVRFYSSGMKQRVRLLLAIGTDSDLLLLDEPTSNLDRKATAWYQEILNTYSGNRTVIVSSNHQQQDYPGFDKFFDLTP